MIVPLRGPMAFDSHGDTEDFHISMVNSEILIRALFFPIRVWTKGVPYF